MGKRVFRLGLVVLAATLPLAGWGGQAAHASNSQADQVCPIVPGMPDIDPDFVSFVGPDSIPGDGAMHQVTVFASESPGEVAGDSQNEVTLNVVVTGNGVAHGYNTGPQSTSVSIDLLGVPGVTYTIDWQVLFDYAVHPCASVMPGHTSFTVTVTDPNGR